jgi:hypothetical protein
MMGQGRNGVNRISHEMVELVNPEQTEQCMSLTLNDFRRADVHRSWSGKSEIRAVAELFHY